MTDENIKSLLMESVDLDVLSLQQTGATCRDFELPRELREIYKFCNGAVMYEGALLLRPKTALLNVACLEEWNAQKTWKERYTFIDLSNIVFFAENTIGEQWGVDNGKVVFFEPETGELAEFAYSVDEWAALIRSDFNRYTRWNLIHEWQENNGPLPLGARLAPIRALTLGGTCDLANLTVVEDVACMRYRGALADRTKNVNADDANGT